MYESAAKTFAGAAVDGRIESAFPPAFHYGAKRVVDRMGGEVQLAVV